MMMLTMGDIKWLNYLSNSLASDVVNSMVRFDVRCGALVNGGDKMAAEW